MTRSSFTASNTMFSRELMAEIQAVIAVHPDLRCHNMGKGIFIVRDGDVSCIAGTTRPSVSFETNGHVYQIHLGGCSQADEDP